MGQYIGARYVPKFMGLYDNTQTYEALCVVDNGLGTSYISKIPTPAGTPLTNTTYWIVYGAASGAIINLQNQIDNINNVLIHNFDTVNDLISADLNQGTVAYTNGYYSTNDGGSGTYIISDTPSGVYETLTNGRYAILANTGTINVLQCGAKGDGITDDIAAFNKALANAECIVVPRGNDKTYKLSAAISLNIRQILVSDMEQSTASFPLLDFADGGINIIGRNVTIDGITIKTTSTNDGITIGVSGGSSLPHITIKNCYIYNSANGINTIVNAWQFLVESVRFVDCVTGFRLIDCGPCVTLSNCYFDGCTQHTLYATDSRFSAIGCNFGIKNNSNVYNDRNNALFADCNFECDETISTIMIRANGRQLKFENCKFGVDGITGCAVFTTSGSLWACVLENCIIGYQGVSAGSGYKPPLVDIDYFNGYKYGCFVIGKGCANLPRFTPYDAQKPFVLDLDNNDVIHFSGTTIDKTKLTAGNVLYSNAQNCLCYFDGTNVVDMSGNTIV